jgi:hypothetical protein
VVRMGQSWTGSLRCLLPFRQACHPAPTSSPTSLPRSQPRFLPVLVVAVGLRQKVVGSWGGLVGCHAKSFAAPCVGGLHGGRARLICETCEGERADEGRGMECDEMVCLPCWLASERPSLLQRLGRGNDPAPRATTKCGQRRRRGAGAGKGSARLCRVRGHGHDGDPAVRESSQRRRQVPGMAPAHGPARDRHHRRTRACLVCQSSLAFRLPNRSSFRLPSHLQCVPSVPPPCFCPFILQP